MRLIPASLTLGLLLASTAAMPAKALQPPSAPAESILEVIDPVPSLPGRPEEIPPQRRPDGSFTDRVTEWTDSSRALAERFQAHLNRAASFRAQRDCGGWRDEVTALQGLLGISVTAGLRRESGRLDEQVAQFYRPFIENEAAQPCEWASPEDEYAYQVLLRQRAEGEFDGAWAEILFGESEIPPANYGFQRDGPIGTSPERPAAFSENRLETYGFAIGLDLGRLSFSADYSWGEASNRTDIPVSTTGGGRGYPYTRTAQSGSTGLGGNVALGVDTEVSTDQISGGVEYSLFDLDRGDDATQWVGQEREVMADFSLGARFVRRDTDHLGVVSITTPVIATQTLDQDIDQLEGHLFLSGEAIVPLGPGVRLTLGGEAGAYLYDFDLRSVETNTQNFGPAADRAFTATIDDSESGIGWFGSARARLGFDAGSFGPEERGQRIEIFVEGQASYRSDRAQVVNPFSGDFVLAGGTTFLDTDDAFDWRIMAGVRLPFYRFNR